MQDALAYYERARNMEPDNPKVLASIARTNHELGNYEIVNETFSQLKIIDPEIAARFAYLETRQEEGARASNAMEQREVVIWDEE